MAALTPTVLCLCVAGGRGGLSCPLPAAPRPLLQGLIFVVDSNDRERVQESADELQKMVSGMGGDASSPGELSPDRGCRHGACSLGMGLEGQMAVTKHRDQEHL